MKWLGSLWVAAALAGAAACADRPSAGTDGMDAASAEFAAAAETAETPSEAEPQTVVDRSLPGMNQGFPEAPVRVVEFSDYGCGACRKFHLETWPTLVRQFLDAGKVEWKFLPYVSGMFKNSTAATTAAECVLEQGEALSRTMSSLVWERQSEWKRADDPAPILQALAREAGADVDRYDGCITEGRRAQRVEAAAALALQNGVRATPTFIIAGYAPIQGALPTDVFVQVLNMVYDQVTKSGEPR